jgi:predicted nucleic acid-binding protein
VATLIDTSVLVAAERGALDLAAVRQREEEDVAISVVTAAELLHGVERLRGVRRARAERFAETLLGSMPIVDFDLPIARVHAVLSADLAEKGVPIGAHDLIIAATAVALDSVIATRDARSFPRIEGLRTVRW